MIIRHTELKKMEQLYEGKAKKVYALPCEDQVLVSYKDDATAFNGLKKGTIHQKGIINNAISNHLFQLLEKHDIPTHFIKAESERETIVKKVDIIPLEVIIRNIQGKEYIASVCALLAVTIAVRTFRNLMVQIRRYLLQIFFSLKSA